MKWAQRSTNTHREERLLSKYLELDTNQFDRTVDVIIIFILWIKVRVSHAHYAKAIRCI